MSTNAELLQRIAQLSGAIRQHQISQTSNSTNSYNNTSNSYRGRGAFRGSLSPRGSSQWTRGGGRGGGSVHRTLNNATPPYTHNKKLVLNQSSPSTTPTTNITPNKIINKSTSYPTFNSSMTYTRPGVVRPTPPPVTQSRPITPSTHEPKRVLINGVSFLVKGKKLIREDKLSTRSSTPVAAVVAAAAKLPATGSHVLVSRRLINGRRDKNGNMFIGQEPRKVVKKAKPQRSKRGNMILVREPEGYVRQGRTGKSLVLKTKRVVRRYCGMFTRYGVCPKATRCTFLHDRNHRAICPKFLLNRCRKSETECRLSHTPTPNIMPHCVHFQRGKCNNAECSWMHVRVRPDAPVCRSFAMEGYCPKGLKCCEKHIHVCPEFAETGKCSNANCRLPHVARRAATAETENKTAPSSSSVAGIVTPGSWVSAAYFNAQRQAKRKQAEEKKKKKGNLEWSNPALQQQQQHPSPKEEEKILAATVVTRKSREEEEEEGFVRLFDDIDDEGGWAQYTSRQEDLLEDLRFNEDESDDEDGAEEEEEEEEDNSCDNDSGSDSEDDYEEFEIADEDGDVAM